MFRLPSELLNGAFVEHIEPHAFDDADSDVVCVRNHDADVLLRRVTSGTLRVSVDRVGLKYECELPGSPTGKDVRASVARGDMSKSSFAFRVVEDEWLVDATTDEVTRGIIKISDVFDVSPVTHAAYPDTTARLRA